MPYNKLFESGANGIYVGGLSEEGKQKYTEVFENIFNKKFNEYYNKGRADLENRINNSNVRKDTAKNTILKLHRDKITSIVKSAKDETAKYLNITVDPK
jgi:hypothetical protein